MPHWRDTVNVAPQSHDAQEEAVPSSIRVLVDLRDPVIRGTFVFHCHIVEHEDQGMMAKIEVQ